MSNILPMKPSDLDEYMMNNRTFDDKKDAWRVSVVDGVTLNVDEVILPEMKFPEIKFPEQQIIKVPEIIKQAEIHQINVPVIIKELQVERIEVPVIVRDIQLVEIEKPVYIHEIKIVEIEKPIVIKETEIKIIETKITETPLYAKVCMIVQAIAITGLLLANLFLKGR